MKKSKLSLILVGAYLGCLSITGCQTAGSGTTIAASASTELKAVFTPANIAAATTQGLSTIGSLVLAKNPTYAGSVQAAADAFTVLATGTLTSLTGADISAALVKSGLPSSVQIDIAAGATIALSTFEKNFATNLPGLQPDYALFARAVANGLLGALGKPPLPMPVSPVTPAPAS